MSPQPYLVTGAAGFIGARFVESCNQRRIPVVSVDEKRLFNPDVRPEHRSIDFGTVIDRDELPKWLSGDGASVGIRPAAIVHMGACSDTTETRWDYLERVNIRYSQDLWNYAVSRKIPFVHASSAATYGDGGLGYEDDEAQIERLQPLNLYGKSKQVVDRWMLEREAAAHVPAAWSAFKFFNVYGFGERHKGKMASVALHAFDQIRADGKVRLFKSHRDGIADGQQKRDFVSIDDVVKVLHFALERPLKRGIYNLGTGQARPFLDLARAVFKAMRKPERVEFVDTPENIRDKYQYFTQAPMEKLRSAGYSPPFVSLEDGVAAYVSLLQSLETSAR